jgi:hypothetical protein
VGVGKLPLAGEEPTKAQGAARRRGGVRGVHEHARQDTLAVVNRQAIAVRALAAASVAAAVVAPSAAAQLTATDLRVASDAARVRVIVDFAGARLTGLARQVDAVDPRISDGRGIVRVNATGISSGATPASGAGVTARVIRRPGSILVRVEGAAGRFKFLQYRVSVPRNVLIVDLWKATAARAATVLDDGCLRLTSWSGADGRARARGLELEPLFEHGLVLSARAPGAGGATLVERPLVATGGVFRPDFSGYLVPGRWGGRTPPAPGLPRRAMLEAWAASAKDGSLECLVQVPIQLIP